MKKVFLTIVSVLVSVCAMAQDNDSRGSSSKVEAELSADLVSNYIWRGGRQDDAAVQPTLGVSYKGLSLSAWGSYGLSGKSNANGESETTKEIDLTLAYTIGKFNVGITDYWSYQDGDVKYFEYRNDQTAHVFEANVGYDFGPVNLQWYTNFAGKDELNEKGKRSYTSYVEANVPFTLATIDWTGTIGAVPYSANNGYYQANASSFAVTNISLKAEKAIKITDSFKLPLFAQITTNPSTQKAYFVFGLTLDPFQK